MGDEEYQRRKIFNHFIAKEVITYMIKLSIKKNGNDTEVFFYCNFETIISAIIAPPAIFELIKYFLLNI